MFRSIPLLLSGLLLFGGVCDAVGQYQHHSETWLDDTPSVALPGHATSYPSSPFGAALVRQPIHRLPPVDPHGYLSGEFFATPSVATIHRLPPVESTGFAASVFPALATASPWSDDDFESPAPLLAASEWLQAGSDSAAPGDPEANQVESEAVAENENKEKGGKENEEKENEEKENEEEEIEGDKLPMIFEQVLIERAPWYHFHLSMLSPWKGSFEMGLDGSSGNSNTFNVRLGASGKRKTKRNAISLDLNYHKNYNNSIETANRMNFAGRCEWLDEETPWTWFVQQTTDYDQFQPWNVRVVGSTGLGYRLLDTDATTLTTRFGSGASQKIGGPDQECVPELNFGVEYEHKMTSRQKVKASAEYFPDVTSFGECRVVAKTSWEVLLNEEQNLSLKVLATDRFNNPNPGGKLNDLDYSVVLLYSF